MRTILFCNIAYMHYYDFELLKETPKHGGKYVTATGDAFEKNNFHICDDGQVRGFVETKYRGGYQEAKYPNKLKIENIDSRYKKANSIDGVTVVFCAHSDTLKKTVIVGWYKNATVYRERPKYNGKQYNLECRAENAYLIDERSRTFIVPRASIDGMGFGQANIWYAKGENTTDFVNSVFNYIDGYVNVSLCPTETIPQEIPDTFYESGVGKKILVNKYERNSTARRKCIELYGTKCIICGFNSADIYGNDFLDKIEVHHIVPINEIQADYKVDPSKDLVPVCPNCHMILHTKMSNGKYPTVSYLHKLINSSILKKLR